VTDGQTDRRTDGQTDRRTDDITISVEPIFLKMCSKKSSQKRIVNFKRSRIVLKIYNCKFQIKSSELHSNVFRVFEKGVFRFFSMSALHHAVNRSISPKWKNIIIKTIFLYLYTLYRREHHEFGRGDFGTL
jgi:hypothetical protein